MDRPFFVTFTGIDEKTDFKRVERLTQRYPIEWGILFGGSRHTPQRYPDFPVVEDALETGVALAAHLCGSYARLAMNAAAGKENLAVLIGHKFDRVQVNSGRYDLQAIIDFQKIIDTPVIIQSRAKDFPDPEVMKGVHPLHDQSGGKGVVPTQWPVQKPGTPLVGYAGGIGPHNVLDVLSKIDASHFWIDMETHIRTDEWLDLDKCESVCKQIWG